MAMKFFKKETQAQWRRRVEEWKESGLRVRDFCRLHGIAEGRFYDWRKRFDGAVKAENRSASHSEAQKTSINFLPVRIKEEVVLDEPSDSGSWNRVEIFLGNGVIVRFSNELSDAAMSRIIKLAGG
jgi:hypothetical protein